MTATTPAAVAAAPEVDEKAGETGTVTDLDIQQPMGLDAGLDEI